MGTRLLNHIVDNDADRKICFRGNSEYKNISRGDPASPIWVVTYTVTDPSASGRIQMVNAIVFLTILSDPVLIPPVYIYLYSLEYILQVSLSETRAAIFIVEST